jgi:Taurine catabolism dioxygenase TauD, TfdA family
LTHKSQILQTFTWADLENDAAYGDWRAAKLSVTKAMAALPPVAIENLSNPTRSEKAELARRCRLVNFAMYSSDCGDSPETRIALRRFAAGFGLRIAEVHRSAGDEGIVALRPSDAESKRGYIPYSTRSMNWHTDGYYNDADFRVSGFVLHCARPATDGGVNQIIDPEMIYIRMRDENPDHLRALMHPAAMTIPENRESDGSLRPASVGPVFYADAETGRMQMRYTARTRSIEWRDDPDTVAAEAFLRQCLSAGDPAMLQVKLKAGQGILNNNVLHNRTGFQKGDDPDCNRLIYRVRFSNRVAKDI